MIGPVVDAIPVMTAIAVMMVMYHDRASMPVAEAEIEACGNMESCAPVEAVSPMEPDAAVVAAGRIPVVGRMVVPPPVAINNGWPVVGNVDNTDVCRLNDNDLFFLLDPYVFQRCEVPRIQRALAQLLDSVHDLAFLHQEGIP